MRRLASCYSRFATAPHARVNNSQGAFTPQNFYPSSYPPPLILDPRSSIFYADFRGIKSGVHVIYNGGIAVLNIIMPVANPQGRGWPTTRRAVQIINLLFLAVLSA